jgi:anthranilate phosphoribosyltransferase
VVLPTYNGARRQANLMPLVAQLLVREGVPVLIQGRHDFDARSGPGNGGNGAASRAGSQRIEASDA